MNKRIGKRVCVLILSLLLGLMNSLSVAANTSVYSADILSEEDSGEETELVIRGEGEERFADLHLATPSDRYLITFSPDTGSGQKELEQAILELDMVAKPEAFESVEELSAHIPSGEVFDERLRRVAGLQASAILAQQEARSLLESLKQSHPNVDIEYHSYWISNTLSVEAPLTVLEYISGFPNVVESTRDEEIETIPYEEQEPKTVVAYGQLAPVLDEREVEENLSVLRADKVWEDLHITGEGVVIGIIDQAVEYEHPALIEHFRGFDEETQSITLEGNYIDFVEDGAFTGGDSHGTHVTGIVLGGESGKNAEGEFSYNRIGVAPGAKFIVARAFKEGVGGTNENIIKACEWMMAPGGDPLKAPQIVNQSWSDGKNDMDLWFEHTAKSLRQAGILNIMSSGNNGSAKALPGSIDNPGSSDQVFTVGASDNRKLLADFSRRGPSPYPNARYKPDVVAPGVQIRSAIPGGEYASYNGTSMAAPHVAGVAALMLEANPDLGVEELEDLLRNTAIPRTDGEYESSPNQGYGYGFVDAYMAVQAALHAAGKGGTSATDYRLISGKVQIRAEKEQQGDSIEGIAINLPQVAYTDRSLRVEMDFYQSDFSPSRIAELTYSIESSEGMAKTFAFVRNTAESDKFTAYVEKENFTGEELYTQKIKLKTKDGVIFESEASPLSVREAVLPGEYKVDFESGDPGFAYKGNFSYGAANLNVDPKPVSGKYFAGLNIGSPYMGALSESILKLPKIDLTGLGENDKAELVYQEYASWDSAVVGIQAALEGEPSTKVHNYATKEKGVWRERRIDLSPFKGKKPSIFFFHLTRNVSDGYGLFIDDVAFTLNGNVQELPELKNKVLHKLAKVEEGSAGLIAADGALIELEGEGIQSQAKEPEGHFLLERVPTRAGSILVGAKGYKTKRLRFAEGKEDLDLGTIVLEKESKNLPQEEEEMPQTAEPGPGMKMLGYDNNNPLSGGAVFSRTQTGVAVELEAPEDGVLSHVMVYFAGENPYFRNGKVSLEIKQFNEAGRLIDVIAPQEVEGEGGKWNKYDLSRYRASLRGKFYILIRQLLPKGEGPAVAIDASVRPGTLQYGKGYYYNGAFESLFGQGIFGMPMIRGYVRTNENIWDEDVADPVFDEHISKEPKAEMLLEEGQKPKDLIIIGDYEISPSLGMITKYLKKDEIFRLPLEERILEIPSHIGGVKIVSIGESAFGYSWGRYEMKKIVLPEGIREVNESAFAMLGSHELVLPSTLEKIYPRAFKQQKISSLHLPEGLRHIGMGAFENCYDLENLYIPDSVEKIEASAFQASAWGEASKLKFIRLPKNEQFTVIHAGAFANHNLVTELEIPEQITTINAGAFKGLGISSLKLPGAVSSLGDSAFEKCSNLREVELPSTLREIGSYAFSACNLQSLTLPVDLEVIDRSAFEKNQLRSLVIPEKVRFINYRAFADNPLHTLRLNTTLVPRTPEQGMAKKGYPTGPHPFGEALERLEIYKEEQVDAAFRSALEGKNPPAQILILGEEEKKTKTFVSENGMASLQVRALAVPDDARLILEPVELEEADKEAIAKLAKGKTLQHYGAYRFYLADAGGAKIDLRTEYSISFHKSAFNKEQRAFGNAVRQNPLMGVPEIVLQEEGGTWVRTGASFAEEQASVRAGRTGKVTLLELKYVPNTLPQQDLYYGIEKKDKLAPPRFVLRTRVEGGNGSVSTFTEDIQDGSELEVRFIPDEGYEPDTLRINGESFVLQTSFVKLVMDEDKELVVRFKKTKTSTDDQDTQLADTPNAGGASGTSLSTGTAKIRANRKAVWVQDDRGWKYKEASGAYVQDRWLQIGGQWYFFNAGAYMHTGWLQSGGKWYYLQPAAGAAQGRMETEWIMDKGKHYYLESTGSQGKPQGAMYAAEYTPDGYYVGADGAWLK